MYTIGERLSGGTSDTVYRAIIQDTTGAVAILGVDSWTNKLATLLEVYTLERCLDHHVHAVRILDISLDRHPPQVHVVMELWGLSGDDYRESKGYGREDAQPANQVRRLLLHLCRALPFLHHGLGFAHTDVKLANILVIDTPESLIGDIDCKLADFGSVEEVGT